MISTQEKTKPITVIGKGEKDSDIQGYTIFKNHDEELVAKIKAVTISEDTFEYDNMFFAGIEVTCRVEKEMDGQLLCIGPKNKRFFLDHDEYKEIRKTELLNKINNLYPVHKYWNQNFGEKFGDKIIKISGSDKEMRYDDLEKVSQIESELSIDMDRKNMSVWLSLNTEWASVMFCHFDTEGNYVNRDYNLDIVAESKRKQASRNEIIKTIKHNIPNEEFQYANNIWFTEEYAIQLRYSTPDESSENKNESLDIEEEEREGVQNIGFSLVTHARNKNGTYGSKYAKIKKPKETATQTPAQAKEYIMEKIIPVINALKLKD